MEIYVQDCRLEAAEEPIVVIGCAEGEAALTPAMAALDPAFGGQISRVLSSGDFRGAAKETRVLYAPVGAVGPARVLLVGLGKRETLDLETLRRCAGEAAVEARKFRTGRVAFALPLAEGLSLGGQARAIVEAGSLALYEFPKYRSKAPEGHVPVERLTLVSYTGAPLADVEQGVSLGRLGAECTALVRDLGNTHAGEATPEYMAGKARALAAQCGLSVTVFEEAELAAHRMGGILAVGRGSAVPPRLVVLEWNGDRRDLDTVCLVGKGITFDTGGISIKPGEGMDCMKYDKAGACVVLATMKAVAALRLPLRVIGIMPFAENMPSGSAYHPGDILECGNGKTIEVLNTDAEGRLILADALAFAATYAPKAIVDLATLTGACVIALGNHCAGLMASDDALAARLTAAGEAVGERLWRLPLFPDYREQLKSAFADMKNIGGREAGAITAAAMLSEFTDGRPWAHIDIAGVSWREKDRDYLRQGGTGFGVRLLMEFLRGFKG